MASSNATAYGFRIAGPCTNERRLIDWPSAFVAYSQCDERAEVNKESYLSAFTFDDAFANYLNSTGTTKGYAGECGAAWVWFDIDRDCLDAATADARKLAGALAYSYDVADDALLCFFSGSKGYHIGLPLAACGSPGPSATFHKVCRRLAESIGSQVGIVIDTGVYDRVRAFRAPNSRHGTTGLFKRWLSVGSLLNLRASRIVDLAREPEPFEIPDPPEPNRAAVDEWAAAVATVEGELSAVMDRRESGAPATLNRATRRFMNDGAKNGDRARSLFSAAANLAELDCSFELAWELLSESALDSGLSPSEVKRQIECGLNHRRAAK
ncbi:DNA primase [Rosistilla oblonga]|uniref:DNA primase n=1 Tax=Rosistilla oblonga TaxID=2527990 RepID=UPI003A979553